MSDPKAIEAGEIARSLVTLWLNDEEVELATLVDSLVRGDPEIAGYALLEQATHTGQLALLLAEERGTTSDEILQALWLRHFRDDLGS